MSRKKKTKVKLNKKLRAVVLVLWLCISAVYSAWQWLQPAPSWEGMDADFSVHFLDVGQGDAVLLQCDGRMVLVDAGPGPNEEQTVQLLQQMGVQELELLIISHGHEDHAGGADAVLEQFPVEQLVLPVEDNRTKFWNQMLVAAGETEITEVRAGWSYKLGEATLTVLYPTKAQQEAASDLNDTSLVIRVEYRDASIYLGGDNETPAEKRLLQQYVEPVTVYKASHHGSSSSSSEALLNALNPEYCVISCGAGNDYGHPHKETLERLAEHNIPVLRTDLQGTITFVYEDGEFLPRSN